ncbi:MAG: hypothetical protein ABI592_14375 [Acidobacteriota bacterium]
MSGDGPEAPGAGDEPGPFLDRMVELRVFGRKPVAGVAPYSTDDPASELVIAHLNRPPLRWMAVREDGGWLFAWREPSATPDGESTVAGYVRLVSAKGQTRAHAVCLAALKLCASRRSTRER